MADARGVSTKAVVSRNDCYCDNRLAVMRQNDAYRHIKSIEHQGKHVRVAGKTLLNLSSNDYLGLAARDDIKQQFLHQYQREQWSFSSSSSRLLTGNFHQHRSLEGALNEAFGRHSLLFNSGYHMNLGILPAIADQRTLIVSDELIHASIIDGIRLSKAQRQRFPHQDLLHLEQLLRQADKSIDIDRVIVVVESLYSMDGDITDLSRLVALKHRYPKTQLYVDEAHAVGVIGERGLGVAEQMDCLREVDFLLGTFGKALASTGGYVICDEQPRELLINCARSLIFSTALPPINAAWSEMAFRLMQTLGQQRKQLEQLAYRVRSELIERGFSCPSQSHIVPVIDGDNRRTLERAARFQQCGIYALPIRPPTVPASASRVRLCLRADLCWSDVVPLLDAL